jgi:hypothetical protein
MRSDASPGPDGFSPGFFKHFWPVVRDDLMSLFEAFQSGDVQLHPLNQAHMVLLPKRDDVITADGFRPISLQATVLKILYKMLTNRIQSIIPTLVTLDESGFIRGREITANFAYAAELVQCCHKRRVPKWNIACRPKDQGGLGIEVLEIKNRCLLSKWLFKLLNEDGVW